MTRAAPALASFPKMRGIDPVASFQKLQKPGIAAKFFQFLDLKEKLRGVSPQRQVIGERAPEIDLAGR